MGTWNSGVSQKDTKSLGQNPNPGPWPGTMFQDHIPCGVAGGETRGAADPHCVLPGLEEATPGGTYL
jgi:hypothetical protein